MKHLHHRLASIIVVLLLAAPAFAQEDESLREKTERVADIMTALGVRDGAHIADLGSSDGFKGHHIAPAIVEAELREAGFDILDRDDAFTTFKGRTIVGGFWMIRARRPMLPIAR